MAPNHKSADRKASKHTMQKSLSALALHRSALRNREKAQCVQGLVLSYVTGDRQDISCVGRSYYRKTKPKDTSEQFPSRHEKGAETKHTQQELGSLVVFLALHPPRTTSIHRISQMGHGLLIGKCVSGHW